MRRMVTHLAGGQAVKTEHEAHHGPELEPGEQGGVGLGRDGDDEVSGPEGREHHHDHQP